MNTPLKSRYRIAYLHAAFLWDEDGPDTQLHTDNLDRKSVILVEFSDRLNASFDFEKEESCEPFFASRQSFNDPQVAIQQIKLFAITLGLNYAEGPVEEGEYEDEDEEEPEEEGDLGPNAQPLYLD